MDTNIVKVLKVQNNISIINMLEKAKQNKQKSNIVFLCVGNSKIWYDCFGPFVGSLIQKLGLEYFVYGNIRSNILLSNIQEYINMIYRFHTNPYIIVLDSSISDVLDFDIIVKEGATVCGAFSQSPLEVGDMKISCLVPAKEIKSSAGYTKMLSEIKRIGFFLNHVFGDKSVWFCKFHNIFNKFYAFLQFLHMILIFYAIF